MRIPKRLGMMLLSVWLVVQGVMHFVPSLKFSGSDNLLAILMIAAGVLLWLDR